MLDVGDEAMTKENPALVAAREYAAETLVTPAKQLPDGALRTDQRFRYDGTIHVDGPSRIRFVDNVVDNVVDVWMVTDETGKQLAATSDADLRIGSRYRVSGTNGELHCGPDWIHVEQAELIANYGPEPQEAARLTKAQRVIYELIRQEGTLTIDEMASLIYLRKTVLGRRWGLLSVEQRRPRVQAVRKHVEKLHLLGLIESKVINRRHYFFVPPEDA